MITFPYSFQNANGSEGDAIGHIFWDRDVEGKYLEVSQAEDYILFRLVHESQDQRYGFESFRKFREFRVNIAFVEGVSQLIRAGVPATGDYPSISRWDEYDDGGEIGFALTEKGLTVGCTLGQTKILKVRLDEDDSWTLCKLIDAMITDYGDYLDRRVFVTQTLREWRHVLATFDGMYPSELIEDAIATSNAQNPDHTVCVEFPDSYDADRVEEALSCTYEYTVAEWREIIHALQEQREQQLANKVAVEVGFRLYGDLMDDPVGTTERTLLEMTFTLDEDDRLQRARFLAAVSA